MLTRRHFGAFGVSSLSILAIAFGALGAAIACSSSSSDDPGTNEGGGGGGGDGGDMADTTMPDVQVTNPNESKQTGQIIDAVSKFSVTGPTITVGQKTAMGGADGKYEIIVPRNVPYSMSVTAEDHWKLNEQEWIVKTPTIDRTQTALLSSAIASILATLLPPRDTKKGILVVRINPLAPCTSEAGSTITIEPAGTSQVTYFSGGKPDKMATGAVKDESFSAAVTDVEPGVNVKVIVNSPMCEQVAFPIDYQSVTYTGNQKTEAGDVLSYIRVFVGPTKIADAGTD